MAANAAMLGGGYFTSQTDCMDKADAMTVCDEMRRAVDRWSGPDGFVDWGETFGHAAPATAALDSSRTILAFRFRPSMP